MNAEAVTIDGMLVNILTVAGLPGTGRPRSARPENATARAPSPSPGRDAKAASGNGGRNRPLRDRTDLSRQEPPPAAGREG